VLDISLSSYEFRTYRKRTGCISLRHRSYLLVTTDAGFRLSAYLSSMSAHLTLPNSNEVEIDTISFTENVQFEYDGQTMNHEFWLSHISPWKNIRPKLGNLRIDYEFTFAGHPEIGVHEHPAIIRPLPYYRAV
jgi:hypothetical protein